MKSVQLSFLILIFFISCTSNTHEMFPLPVNNSCKIDTSKHYLTEKILIDTTINTTFEGKIGVHRDKLYFIDNLFCKIYFFDERGRCISQHLGMGRSQSETTIGLISCHTFLSNDNLCLFGSADDVHIFNSKLIADKQGMYRKSRNNYKIGEKIDYDQFELYSMGHPIVCRNYKESVFTNNSAEDPLFNYYETPNIFTKEFRGITEQDLKRKDTGRLLGKGLPAIYDNNSSTHYIFSSLHFDIDNKGNFYVGYMADSLIYKYDKEYLPIQSFGFEGRNMDKDYLRITEIDDIRYIGIPQYETKGYYNWIEYIDELDYLCRSYAKGEHSTYDGLQIYKSNILIADIDVPKGFKPVGYIEPYLYSDAIVVDNEKMYIYRIKIN